MAESALQIISEIKKLPTQSRRRQQRENDTITGPVSLEHFTLDECLTRTTTQLLPHLFLGLTESQSLRLSKEIAK
jgi:hypothetical protein